MHHTKFQPNLPSGSGQKNDFIGFTIFSYGGHLAFLTGLNCLQSDNAVRTMGAVVSENII